MSENTSAAREANVNRPWLWIALVAVAIAGGIAAAAILPTRSQPSTAGSATVQVPNMQNVPPPGQKLNLEVEGN